jgi:uncharacterized OB-fold protein
MTEVTPVAARMLPRITDANRAFYTGGREGRLLVGRCQACRRWALPPATDCPGCGGALVPTAASGRARLWTWTLNSYPYHPDIPLPYLIAVVVLEEQEDLRVATNLVDCEEPELRAGMELTVAFEDHGEVFYPVFRPTRTVEESS